MKKPTYWIFFYEEDPTNKDKLRECIGTGSVLPVDKRYSVNTIINMVYAEHWPVPNKAVALAIHRGERLIDTVRVTNYMWL